MKKFFVGCMLLMMLALGTTAYAKDPLYSPENHEVPPPEHPTESPKTGDINILLIEGIGLGAAAVALVTSRKKTYA